MPDKDGKILMDLFRLNNGEALPAVGFSSADLGKEYVFVFHDGTRLKARLAGSNSHCSYDSDGNPRNLLINLDFVDEPQAD